MATLFGIDTDSLISSLRACGDSQYGCIKCSYKGKCDRLEKDAAFLIKKLIEATKTEDHDHYYYSSIVHTLNACDGCYIGEEKCSYFKLYGPKGCDVVQREAARAIEDLYSVYVKNQYNSFKTKCLNRPFYVKAPNGSWEEVGDSIEPFNITYSADAITEGKIYDVKTNKIGDALDAVTYTQQIYCNAARGNGKTLWQAKFLQEALKNNMETKFNLGKMFSDSLPGIYFPYKNTFTPKSIEVSADHKTVVVVWKDKSTTIVRLSPNDPDDIYMAFTAALGKKIFGNNSQLKKVIGSHLNEHKKKKKGTNNEE